MGTAPTTFTELEDVDAATTATTATTVLTGSSELLALSLLRDTINGTVSVFVPPASPADTDGSTDTAAIQAAIDAVQTATGATNFHGEVVLSGYYYLNAPLVFGVANTTVRKVNLRCLGQTAFYRAGTATGDPGDTDYCLKFFGVNGGNTQVVGNLRIYCNYKARGILFASVSHCSFSDIQVYGSMESGIDFVDCWNCTIQNVSVNTYRGFAYRAWDSNACHFDKIEVYGGYAAYSTNQTTITDANLANYAMANGGYANSGSWTTPGDTYAAVLAESWPHATNDTRCTDYAGNVHLSAATTRSAFSLANCNGTTFTTLSMESNRHVDYPLVYLYSTSHNIQFCGTRMESNQCLYDKFHCDGCDYVTVDDTFIDDGDAVGGDDTTVDTNTGCECFLRCTGTTRGNRVSRLIGHAACTDNVIILDDGTHTGTTCTECATDRTYIEAASWIGEVNTPTVDANWPARFYLT